MTDRKPLDDMTSDDLDQLYDRLDRAEAAVLRARLFVILCLIKGFALARVSVPAARYATKTSADSTYAAIALDVRRVIGDAWDAT